MLLFASPEDFPKTDPVHKSTIKSDEILRIVKKSVIDLPDILKIVSDETGISAADLKSSALFRHIAHARFVFYLTAHVNGFSMPRIGQFLNKHHTTILHGIKKLHDLMLRDDNLAAAYRRSKYRCEEHKSFCLEAPNGPLDKTSPPPVVIWRRQCIIQDCGVEFKTTNQRGRAFCDRHHQMYVTGYSESLYSQT